VQGLWWPLVGPAEERRLVAGGGWWWVRQGVGGGGSQAPFDGCLLLTQAEAGAVDAFVLVVLEELLEAVVSFQREASGSLP
jgi:hypothetical protein